MIDTESLLRSELDRLFPAPVAQPDWQAVLRDAREAMIDYERSAPRKPPRRTPPRRSVLALLATTVIAAALVLTLTSPWRGGPTILEQARAAITVNAGQVLHERIISTFPNLPRAPHYTTEVWLQGAPPLHWRSIVTGLRRVGTLEQAGTVNASRYEQYDSAKNKITLYLNFGPFAITPADPIAALRSALASRTAKVEGTRTVAGKRLTVIKINSIVTNPRGGWDILPGAKPTVTYYVTPASYQPVKIVFTHVGGGAIASLGIPYLSNDGTYTVIDTFKLFQLVPATPANLRLTTLKGAHPTATCTVYGDPYPCANPSGKH